MSLCFANLPAAVFVIVIIKAIGQLTTSGLFGHWDATIDASVLRTGSSVTEWKDQSSALIHVKGPPGVGGHAPQFSSTGLNGQPGIHFEPMGRGAGLVSTTKHQTYGARPFTWFAVLQTEKPSEVNIQYIFSTNDASKDNFDCIDRECWDNSMPRAVAIGGGGWNCWAYGKCQKDNILLPVDTPLLVTLWSNGTTLRLYHSTQLLATDSVHHDWPVHVKQGYVSMGLNMLVPTAHQFTGYIGEVAAYTRALNENELEQSQHFLNVKWGLITSTTTRSSTITSVTTSSNTVTMTSSSRSRTVSSTTKTMSTASSTTSSTTSSTRTASTTNTFTSTMTWSSTSSTTHTLSSTPTTSSASTTTTSISITSSTPSTTLSSSSTATLTSSVSSSLSTTLSSTLSPTSTRTSITSRTTSFTSTSVSISSITTSFTSRSSTSSSSTATATRTVSSTISTNTRSLTRTSTSSTVTASSCTETVSSTVSSTSTSASNTHAASSTTSVSSNTFTSTSLTTFSSTASTTTPSTTTTSKTANIEMVESFTSSLFEEPVFWIVISSVAIGAAAGWLAMRVLSRIWTSFKQEPIRQFTEFADHDGRNMPLTDPAAPEAAKELPTTSHVADTWKMSPQEKEQEMNHLQCYPADGGVESVHMSDPKTQPLGELPSSEDSLQMLRVAASVSSLQPTEPESEPPLLQLPGQMDSTRISAPPCSAEEQVLKACQELVQDLEALFSSRRRGLGACIRTELDSLLEEWSMRQLAVQKVLDSPSASMLRRLTSVVRSTITTQAAGHTTFVELKQIIEEVMNSQIAENAANNCESFRPPAQDVQFFCETPKSVHSLKGLKRESIQAIEEAGNEFADLMQSSTSSASDVGLFRSPTQNIRVAPDIPRCTHSEIEVDEEERAQVIDEADGKMVDDEGSAGEDSSDEEGEDHPEQTLASWCPSGLDQLQSAGDDLLQDLKVVLAFSTSGDLLLSELEDLFEWWGAQHPSLLGDSATIATVTNPGTNYRAKPPLLELARKVCLELLNKGCASKPATINYSKLKAKIEDSWRRWMMDSSLSSGSRDRTIGLAAGSSFAQPRRRSTPFLLADMSESPVHSRSAIAALRPLRTKSSELLM